MANKTICDTDHDGLVLAEYTIRISDEEAVQSNITDLCESCFYGLLDLYKGGAMRAGNRYGFERVKNHAR